MGTVVGTWRLRVIIIMFILLTCIYTSYSLFQDIEIGQYNVDESDYSKIGIKYNSTDEGEEISDSFIDVIFGIGDFLTFGAIDNFYARLVINIFVSVCWITIGYVLYTFVKEWIPFV